MVAVLVVQSYYVRTVAYGCSTGLQLCLNLICSTF
eukprot:COSAG01_NODE_30204_length_620_cov_9.988484_1_plen_34_part_10